MTKRKTATQKEIYEFWTLALRNEETDFKDELKVSELIAKCLGMFNSFGQADREEAPERMSLQEKLALIDRIKNDDIESVN